jgi:MSHA biogenesis protein MshP
MTGRLHGRACRSGQTGARTSRCSAAARWATSGAQCGFGLVSAIFLLVVLSSLGAAIVSVFTIQQASSALDVTGARAYQAARAGIEWGLYQQLRAPSPGATVCFSDTSFGFPDTTTLRPLTVTVGCVLTQGPGTIKRWHLSAVACNQPDASTLACPNRNDSPDYVEREMQVDY